jgi:hypothetical protein
MVIAAPLLVAVVGALVYGLTAGKASELGRLAFAVGLFFVVAALGDVALHLGR